MPFGLFERFLPDLSGGLAVWPDKICDSLKLSVESLFSPDKF